MLNSVFYIHDYDVNMTGVYQRACLAQDCKPTMLISKEAACSQSFLYVGTSMEGWVEGKSVLKKSYTSDKNNCTPKNCQITYSTQIYFFIMPIFLHKPLLFTIVLLIFLENSLLGFH